MDLRRGQMEHPELGDAGAWGGEGLWDRGAVGEAGCACSAQDRGEPPGVLVPEQPPDSLRVHAQAQLVAESDRDDLRGDLAERESPGVVQIG